MTTQTYRRARHSVSGLQAHLVFVTKYRRQQVSPQVRTQGGRDGIHGLSVNGIRVVKRPRHTRILRTLTRKQQSDGRGQPMGAPGGGEVGACAGGDLL